MLAPSPLALSMACPHPLNPLLKLIHFIDPKHVIKRLRNMVLSSGFGFKRLLKVKGHPVVWKHWQDVYNWDLIFNLEMMWIHHRLTNEHMHVTPIGKMRNHLAEQILNDEMLYLIKAYAQTLQNPSQLDGTIEFLTNTSFIVALFNNTLPLTTKSDERLTKITQLYSFFENWVSEDQTTTMTQETRDLTLYILAAFSTLSELLLSKSQSFSPAHIKTILSLPISTESTF